MKNRILVFIAFLMVGACTPTLVRDMGSPSAWNDNGQSYIESIHVTLLPGLINEHVLDDVVSVLQDTMRAYGLRADVEIYDRLALESPVQRSENLNERDYDVYVRMSLKYWSPDLATYRMFWYTDAEAMDTQKFYEMTVAFGHSNEYASDELIAKYYKIAMTQFMEKLQKRDLLGPKPSGASYY